MRRVPDLDRTNLARFYYWRGFSGPVVSSRRSRVIKNYRSRLRERGLVRLEVLGLHADRDLIRSLARRLMEEGPHAARLRRMVSQTIAGEPTETGGILAALGRSPLAGADLDLARSRGAGHSINL